MAGLTVHTQCEMQQTVQMSLRVKVPSYKPNPNCKPYNRSITRTCSPSST